MALRSRAVWTGVVLGVVGLISWAAPVEFSFRVSSYRGERLNVVLGCVRGMYGIGCGTYMLGLEFPTSPESCDWIFGWRSSWGSSEVVVGGWVLFLLLAVVPLAWRARRWVRRRQRRGRGWCIHCGYDLKGNVSGRCPECGARTGLVRRVRSA